MDLTQKHTKWLTQKSFKISKLASNQIIQFKLNLTHSWPKELILELDQLEKIEEIHKDERLIITLKIERKWNKELDQFLIIDGHILSDFMPPCIRCLCPSNDKLDFSFHACVIDSKLENDPDFEELTTYFIDGMERELFYYQEETLNLYELVHELIYLTKDNFPLHDQDCLGLCAECGQNLNTKVCKHQSIN